MTRTYKPRKPATLALAVQLEFEPNRLEQSYLQHAYAQLLPIHSRRLPISTSIPIVAGPTPVTLEYIKAEQGKLEVKRYE